MTTVTIDAVQYEPVTTDGRNGILVLDRGFIVYGTWTIRDHWVLIRNCACIRKWGTTKGLGQLAESGPTVDTVLDPQPPTRVHELQVVQIIDCQGETWTLQ